MRLRPRTIIRSIPLLLLGLIVIGYALFTTRVFIEGPDIRIESPSPGMSFFDPRITLEGTAEHIKQLYLDDRPINISPTKTFKEKLLLLPGYNIITVRGIDAFGRTRTKTLELVLLQDLDIDKLIDTSTVEVSTSSTPFVTSDDVETSTTTSTLE